MENNGGRARAYRGFFFVFYLYASLTAGAAALDYCFIMNLFLVHFLPLLALFEAISGPVRHPFRYVSSGAGVY